MARKRKKLAVWKFASCDGCQLTLLDCEDDQLWRWFLHHSRPDDPDLDAAVRHVLAAAQA